MNRWQRRQREPTRVARGGTLVAAEGVTVELGGTTIVDGVDLEVRAGEVVALVGPNGSGKSTLLAAIAGDLPIARGIVRVGDEPIATWTPGELAMRRAVLPQQAVVVFPFTVAQVVAMGRAPWAATELAEDDQREIALALEATDVAALARRSFTSLSGGEQARVMLARVLAQRSQLLVLDEPTAALDLHHDNVVLATARERAEAGDGVLVVLHDVGSAGACADRVVLLADGRIVASGRPGEVLVPELLSRVYHHDVDVFPHPTTGELLVLPRRDWRQPGPLR